MARVSVRHVMHPPTIYALLTSPRGGVARDMYRRAQNVRTAAQRGVHSDTGRLVTSIDVIPVTGPGGAPGYAVGSGLDYAGHVHRGHGVIVPRRPGGVLRFRPRGGRWVFARRVRAVPPVPYLKNALRAARD